MLHLPQTSITFHRGDIQIGNSGRRAFLRHKSISFFAVCWKIAALKELQNGWSSTSKEKSWWRQWSNVININASFTFISKAVKIDLFISGQFRAILKVALKTPGILCFLGRYKKKWYPHFHNFSKASFSLPIFQLLYLNMNGTLFQKSWWKIFTPHSVFPLLLLGRTAEFIE